MNDITFKINNIKLLGIISQILIMLSSLGGILGLLGYILKFFVFHNAMKVFQNKNIFKNFIISFVLGFISMLVLILLVFILSITARSPLSTFSETDFTSSIYKFMSNQFSSMPILVLVIVSYIILVFSAIFYKKVLIEFHNVTEIETFKWAGNLTLWTIILLPVIIGFIIGVIQMALELVAFIEINPGKIAQKLEKNNSQEVSNI